jgi:hypothetical protein
MIAALLAAGVIGATPPPPSAIVPPGGTVERTPNLYRQPANCRAIVEGELARQQVAFRGQLPAVQYAVDRKLDGCSVPTPVGYHPSAPATREDAPSNRR